MVAVFAEPENLDSECKHGLTKRTCDHCLGHMRHAPYRQALAAAGFIDYAIADEEESRRDCELCGTRGVCKRNRIYAKQPRPPMKAFGSGVPAYAPSYAGPVIEGPRIYEATHRMRNGRYACDRCDPDYNTDPQPYTPGEDRRTKEFSAADVFA